MFSLSRCLRVVLAALSLPLLAYAAVPVAPFEPFRGEMSWDELNADSASNGRSTFIVWENAFHFYAQTHSVYARFVDEGREAELPVLLERSAITPVVATNGEEYLVAYARSTSRFNVMPYDNVVVRRVSPDGTIGAPRVINTSAIASGPNVGDAVWTGRYWMVAYSDRSAKVAFLTADLDLALPTLTLNPPDDTSFQYAPHLVEIRGEWWAVFSTYTHTEAVEIRSDGAAGRRHSIDVTGGRMATTAAGALLVHDVLNGDRYSIRVAPFDPNTGFAPAVATGVSGVVTDARPSNGAVLAIVKGSSGTASSVDAVLLSATGAVIESRRLLAEEQVSDAWLGDSHSGRILLVSSSIEAMPALDTRTALYAWPLGDLPLSPLAASSRELISVAEHGAQQSPLIASNGTSLVAFWSQTTDSRGGLATFSRRILDDGTPTGVIYELPFVLRGLGDIAFDGERFFIVWDEGGKVFATSVSSDGQAAGPAIEVGSGTSPRVAARDGAAFVVWTPYGQPVHGTPLRRDGSPEVPGGFPILPSFTMSQSKPDIAAIQGGFLVLWPEAGIKSVTISLSGTPRSSSQLTGDTSANGVVVASHASGGSLAAWRTSAGAVLRTFAGGDRPFDVFDPHWGKWTPVSLEAAAEGRYIVGLTRDGAFLVGEVTMTSGGYITRTSTPRFFAPGTANTFSAAANAGGTVAIWVDGNRVFVGAGEEIRRRSVRVR